MRKSKWRKALRKAGAICVQLQPKNMIPKIWLSLVNQILDALDEQCRPSILPMQEDFPSSA